MLMEKTRPPRTGRKIHAIAAASSLILGGTGAAWGADFENGFELYKQHCAGCHTHIARIWDKSGPNLNGLFGRRAGAANYLHGYSEAMRESNLTWNLGSLMAFITSPAGVVRGTNMVFRGLDDPTERADLLCYLRQATDPQPTGMPSDCDDL